MADSYSFRVKQGAKNRHDESHICSKCNSDKSNSSSILYEEPCSSRTHSQNSILPTRNDHFPARPNVITYSIYVDFINLI